MSISPWPWRFWPWTWPRCRRSWPWSRMFVALPTSLPIINFVFWLQKWTKSVTMILYTSIIVEGHFKVLSVYWSYISNIFAWILYIPVFLSISYIFLYFSVSVRVFLIMCRAAVITKMLQKAPFLYKISNIFSGVTPPTPFMAAGSIIGAREQL